MHPDGATEAIVDFALAADKPFALVPCCVYAVAFPGRRDEHGRPVSTHEAFVRYLVAKRPERIRTATLPFGGRNTVVYALPSPSATAAGAADDVDGGGACELCAPCG